MDKEFRAFLETPEPGLKRVRRRRGYNAFGWTICILLLTGVVLASWIGSFYVFNHPEDPDCYHFLKEMNRIEPIKRFELTAAPAGKFLTPRELYDTYLTMSPDELQAKNEELLRDYLRNYAGVKTPIPYIWGRFTTTGVYELAKSDMFPSGMVALADSVDCPEVRIEHIYPTGFANVPRARQMLAADPEIRLEKSFNLATIVHVGKLDDGKFLFTVIPIDYGPCAYKQGISSTFRLDPPSSLNLEAGLPVVKPDAMANAEKTFALYRKNSGLMAKANMVTLPTTPASSQATDFTMAQDLPPEALQPYKSADTVEPPADEEPASQSPTASAAPATMPPAGELPPVTAPSSGAIMAQTAPEPAPTASIPASTANSAVSQSPAVSSVGHPATVARVANTPAIAKTGLPQPTVSSAATSPAIPAHTMATAPKPLKPVAKTSVAAAVPSPAPAVRPVTHIQSPPSSTAAIAALPHGAVSRPDPSTFAGATQPMVKSPIPPASVAVIDPPVQFTSPAPVEYADAVPPETSPSGVKLDPFISSQSAPAQPVQLQQQPYASTRNSSWQTYLPGMMPRGKLITMYQAPQLADLGIGNDRLYVDGRFVVTASSDGRAVLRPVNYNGALSGTGIRMVVEYPNGTPVPTEGTQVARGTLRPFQVVDVRRGNDGQVNIYAREVTVPVNQTSSPGAQRDYRYRMAQNSGAYD